MSLVVVRAVGLITVQDGGRPGHMHEGLAPGGALVPALLAAANRRVRNADDCAGLEVMGTLTLRATRRLVVATDDEPPRMLDEDEEVTVASEGRRGVYLAVRGGVEAPVVLGSRSTQLSAGIGGLLRRGMVIDVDGQPERERPVEMHHDESGPIGIVAGPDLDWFAPPALEHLTSLDWLVHPASDRVGTRLEGPPLPRLNRPEATRPLVIGAIEVPSDGRPIVLGPEHPTTGGYPVIGVVVQADLGRFFTTAVGSAVRFHVRD